MAVSTFDLEYRNRRVASLRTKLADSGCRITPQRIAILDALVNGASHPTADEIFALVRKVSATTSLATVYKTLDTLKALGEVQELELGSGRNHYDAVDPISHPHVVCTKCGRIEDVRFTPSIDLIGAAAKASGYQLLMERHEFFGHCQSCREDKELV